MAKVFDPFVPFVAPVAHVGSTRRGKAPAARALAAAQHRGQARGLTGRALAAALAAVQRVAPRRSRGRALALVPPAALAALAPYQDAEAALLRASLPAPALAAYRVGALSFAGVLTQLPYALAQRLLDIREEGMRAFFAAWAESIARNAKLEREASELAQRRGAAVARADVARHDAAAARQRAYATLLQALAAQLHVEIGRIDAARHRLERGAPGPVPARLAPDAHMRAARAALRGPSGTAALPLTSYRGPEVPARQQWLAALAAHGPQLVAPRQPTGFALRHARVR